MVANSIAQKEEITGQKLSPAEVETLTAKVKKFAGAL